MKQKFALIVFFGIILFGMSGCSNDKQEDNEVFVDEEISLLDLKEMIEDNSMLIEELTNKNLELEDKISSLEEENETLNKTIEDLQNKDKDIGSSIDSRYNELKDVIDSKMVSNGNNYIITKEQLVGTWNIVGDHGSETFSADNIEIIGNWIIIDGANTLYYMYKDGKLYVADNGWIFTK